MSRAEQRRRDKADKKDRKRAEAILKQMGFPEFQMPPAPMRTNKLSIQEVSNLTGTKVAVLEQWRKEQIEEIKKACIVESQERLDVAENFITLSNVIASLKALDGFRYAKSAALHMLKHFNDCIESVKEENVQQTYKELNEKWGLKSNLMFQN